MKRRVPIIVLEINFTIRAPTREEVDSILAATVGGAVQRSASCYRVRVPQIEDEARLGPEKGQRDRLIALRRQVQDTRLVFVLNAHVGPESA